MSPSYLFQVDEIGEVATAQSSVNAQGNLIPSTKAGDHVSIQGAATGRLFYCDTQKIFAINHWPQDTAHYKTFSVYFHGGHGFWVLRGDAKSPIPGESWQPLRFDHSDTDYSSFLTNAGEHATLRVQRSDQRWQSLLLPDIYHTSINTNHGQYGGLTGELPLLLALITMSTRREWVPNVLPIAFVNGAWAVHPYQVPRADKRGVVVKVYTCGDTTANDLDQYEHGNLGKYFN